MKAINFVLSLSLITLPAQAQNSMTSSPYSMFGIGEPEPGLYGQNTGMGGVSYGMRHNMLMNIENPAGLTALDSKKLLIELSAFAKYESYASGKSSSQSFTGNFPAFMLGGRIAPRWYTAISLTPYSSVGYYFQSYQPIEGNPYETHTSTFTGSGGISRISLSNAYHLSKRWSMGLNISYLFGTITQSEEQDKVIIDKKMYARSLYVNPGIQYHYSSGNNLSFTVGAVYGYRKKLHISNEKIISHDGSGSPQKQKDQEQSLPQYFGIGASLQYKKWTYALDYAFRQYSSLTSADKRIQFRDVHEGHIGICYLPDNYSDTYWKRVSYKAGIDVATSYMSIHGNSGFSLRFNAGLGLPVFRGRINAGLFYDRMHYEKNILGRHIIGATVSITISELFYRRKFE